MGSGPWWGRSGSGDDVIEAVEVVGNEAAVGVGPVDIDFGADEDAAPGFAGDDFGANGINDGAVGGFEDVVGNGDEAEVEFIGTGADGRDRHFGGVAAVGGMNMQVVINCFHLILLSSDFRRLTMPPMRPEVRRRQRRPGRP